MIFDIDKIVETFGVASEENQLSPLREQQIVKLGTQGELWITGDLHDHQRNFEKVVEFADLGSHPTRHLILHELIHGDRFDANGAEGSWEMLYRAADLKCDFPSQVHFLMANHDLAQIYGEGIMKAGMSVCEAFNAGLERDFGNRAGLVNAALSEFLLSSPLAVQTANGLFICHSLPTNDQLAAFDFGVFNRALTGADYLRRTGAVYQLVWGRNMSPETAANFAETVGASLIITGHQPQESGYKLNGEHHLIIATDHNQGVVLRVDLSKTYTIDSLVESIEKVGALGADLEL